MPGERKLTLRITAVLIGILGLAMAWQGLGLALVGGTPYYAGAGLLLVWSAVDLFRARPRGFVVYGAAVLLTLAWAVYEAGNAFWLVGSRIWLIGIISLWLCTPVIRRRLWPQATPKLFSLRTVQVVGVATAGVLLAMTADLLATGGRAPDTVYGPSQNSADWTAYGASNAGTRYAPHAQIDAGNVADLQPVWQAETRQPGRFQATPIQIGDGIYVCTAANIILALDADTGEERWRFDPENDVSPYSFSGNCRGVTYARIPDVPEGQHCAERIFTATSDARMVAVDMHSGEPCDEFGDAGQISLLAGMGEVKPFFYFVTSPPTLASGVLVLGGWVADNQEVEEPSGVVRAYDPRDGSLVWAWDMGREGQTGLPPEGAFYTRGTPNVWSLTSADDELGLVYVPTGNATPDYFGGHRTPVMDKYASSIVAIDAATGLTRWHYQTTHHDIWDYDVPSQPTLVDLTLDGRKRQAVIVPTKRGETFVLDRATGELITEVVERPVPQTDVPHERSTATQPFSTGMPSFAYPRIEEHNLFGLTPFDQMACRETYYSLRYEGPMTPPSVEGTLVHPGPGGGQNWGSVAVDEQRQLMVVNNMNLPAIVKLIPREEDQNSPSEGLNNRGYGIGGPQAGTPYAARVTFFMSPLSLPCLQPPYGEMAVVDLTTQQIVWRRGNGFWELGLPAAAGSVVTAGGLIFNGGVMDGQLRALDLFTGDVLWQDALRSPSSGTPMSYVSPKTGRQYVLVTVPGASRPPIADDHSAGPAGETPPEPAGGLIIAYALPEADSQAGTAR